jgi:hypothetical protein
VPADRYLDVRNVLWLLAAMRSSWRRTCCACRLGGVFFAWWSAGALDLVVGAALPPRCWSRRSPRRGVGTFLTYGRIFGREAGSRCSSSWRR